MSSPGAITAKFWSTVDDRCSDVSVEGTGYVKVNNEVVVDSCVCVDGASGSRGGGL